MKKEDISWFFVMAFLIVPLVLGIVLMKAHGAEVKVPIRERIILRFVDEIGNDTEIAQKLTEGTETDTSIREKKQIIIDEEIQNDVVKIKVQDVSYGARGLRKETNYAVANDKFKKYLWEKNYVEMDRLLREVGVKEETINILIENLKKYDL